MPTKGINNEDGLLASRILSSSKRGGIRPTMGDKVTIIYKALTIHGEKNISVQGTVLNFIHESSHIVFSLRTTNPEGKRQVKGVINNVFTHKIRTTDLVSIKYIAARKTPPQTKPQFKKRTPAERCRTFFELTRPRFMQKPPPKIDAVLENLLVHKINHSVSKIESNFDESLKILKASSEKLDLLEGKND